MKKIKCILFDCDGVLVDSEGIGNQVLLNMAAKYGLKISLNEAYKKFNGRSLKDCFQQIEQLINQPLPENFEIAYRKKSFEAFATQIKPIKGVMKFLNSLTIPYCVASSGPVEKIQLTLKTAGLIDKFENKIFSSYQINSWKPDPGIFLHAAQQMGFSVEECLVIEDSLAGVIAAKRGGFKVFGLANEKNSKELENEGAILFYTFEELAKFFKHQINENDKKYM
jgi:HAD superfamily hydrolase (TIGR01509 family)